VSSAGLTSYAASASAGGTFPIGSRRKLRSSGQLTGGTPWLASFIRFTVDDLDVCDVSVLLCKTMKNALDVSTAI